MSEITECPNCQADLRKKAFYSNNKLLTNNERDLINEYSIEKKKGYCEKCSLALYQQSVEKLKQEVELLKSELRELIKNIPILTIQNLPCWKYRILQMVTGQSTTGTGALTEFTSSFTDFFGQQSSRHNAKLKAGEELCMAQIRHETYELGGNAIIGVDVDYSDAGGGKGMLIVCMSGTAINVDLICFSELQQRSFGTLEKKKHRLEFLKNFKTYKTV
ncbi:heavy metal-binding domain-containing protein [Leeuwenhoekiella sp. MAR_2009_132]|uniref:heavy metal-binding domain-containing protein n=1 Tax=Leeuwenhoekiella sp. MAR_2009_132 TaxID=1392489 RepID=UPI00068D5809|nr:heavy metal-binding domain-containing protein [Leeuwenhoekiella sp. MAR_2009_132]